MYEAKKPVFALYLDARSAFDNVLRQLLIRNLYLCGTTPGSIAYINQRLKHRMTVLDWDKQLMGPICDMKGVEQGGANSSDYYKTFGKSQLVLAENSGLGVELHGGVTVSAVGQADDTILLSNSLHALENLLELTLYFCKRYSVQLCADKTRLQAFATPDMLPTVDHICSVTQLSIDDIQLKFVTSSMQGPEHVGIIRAGSGNLPHILHRVTSHKKSMAAVMHAGVGRGHRGNPAASLRIHQLYGTPVLLSGIGALALKKSEIEIIDNHYKVTLESLMKLHPRSPISATHFLAGSLPGTALVHLRILSNFGMIARKPQSLLHKLALDYFSCHKLSAKSWFDQVRKICLMYQLPHPLILMRNQQPEEAFKKLTRSAVIRYWETKYRQEALQLPSLKYFHPEFMSLSTPHQLWRSAHSSSYEVSKAIVQARMLSGRYRTELLCSHWSANRNGWCLTPSCQGCEIPEDLEHILAFCPSLDKTRENLLMFSMTFAQQNPVLLPILATYTNPAHPLYIQFLLDCSCLQDVISITNLYGLTALNKLFYVGRTWCYSLHRDRARLLNRWTFK